MAGSWGGAGGGWGGRMPAQPAQPPWTQSGVPGLVSSGGGGAGSTAGQGAGVNNAYDKTGNLSSILSREGIDIGPQPDFFGDLNQIVSRLRPQPVPTAALQAGALRDRTAAAPVSAPVQYERPMMRAGGPAGGGPTFAQLTNIGMSSPFYQPWRPGMPISAGNAPVATYSG